MAIKDRYTLDDFTTYARKNFPVAFENIDDLAFYDFDINCVFPDNNGVREVTLLHIAFWNGRHHRIPVWATLNGSHVQYSYGRPGCTIKSTQGPYPTEGYSTFKGYKSPFHLVAERSWPQGKQALSTARALTRMRLALLVRFVFLMAGHIHEIENDSGEDLLLEFKDVCMHMQQQKEAIAEENRKREEQFQRWAEEEKLRREAVLHDQSNVRVKVEDAETEATEHAMTRVENAQSVDLEQRESDRSSKRVAIDMSDEFIETNIQHTRKRARLMSPSENGSADPSNPILPEQPSTQVQSILESLVKQCRAEVEQEQASQNKTLQAEMAQLRAELAEQKQKAEDAERKFKEHEADWQTRHEQQETMIVNLEGEVKQWKEKYEKLNRKVQIFLKDD